MGITTPAPEELGIIAVLWIAIGTLLAAGLVVVFFFLLQQLRRGVSFGPKSLGTLTPWQRPVRRLRCWRGNQALITTRPRGIRLTVSHPPRHNRNSHFEVIMLAFIYVLFALLMRIPHGTHPWNFTPVMAALLYFGARGARRLMWLPLGLLVASDIVLDRYYSYPLSWDLLLTWAWYAAMLWLGGAALRRDSKVWRIAGAAVAGSASFFLISNFGVWAATAMYPKTLSGLMTCYAAGVPFFRHTVEGDLLFSAVLFGIPVAVPAIARWVEKVDDPAAAA